MFLTSDPLFQLCSLFQLQNSSSALNLRLFLLSFFGSRFLLLLAQLNLPVFPESLHVFTLALLCSVSSAFLCVPGPLAHSPASYYFISLELQACTSDINYCEIIYMVTNYTFQKTSSVNVNLCPWILVNYK